MAGQLHLQLPRHLQGRTGCMCRVAGSLRRHTADARAPGGRLNCRQVVKRQPESRKGVVRMPPAWLGWRVGANGAESQGLTLDMRPSPRSKSASRVQAGFCRFTGSDEAIARCTLQRSPQSEGTVEDGRQTSKKRTILDGQRDNVPASCPLPASTRRLGSGSTDCYEWSQ